ncbi:TlpA disulfide reductase family protein [Gimesia aquarii]|uniref:Thiol-disulfide oxidoreductase ResA n=1 Tax=Gimesia aquarii TaxID=2527964 RepID=A0A517VVX4_9PLAN|nr:TlpA disulfide reductase family protein [Gimesia aquarii]QDT97140.1 Thiol-disulfide oxidoreductase ResA [Gimesia aquarii]
MRIKDAFCCLILVSILPVTLSWGDDSFDVVQAYKRIVADHQRATESIQSAIGQASLDRLTRDAYRLLLERAKADKKLSADDLYALGACNEAIGNRDEAKKLYAASLSKSATAKTHLALTRVNLKDNLVIGEKHYAAAAKLQPEHPDLSKYRLLLLSAHQKNRNWNEAIPHLNYLLAYTKTLADNAPANSQLRANYVSVKQQLDRASQFAKMKSSTAPPLKIIQAIQGKVPELQSLKGKVVVLDFFAIWSGVSHNRISLLKTLQAKYKGNGVEVIGVTLPYEQKYDPKLDAVAKQPGLTPAKEASFIATFAKKHSIPWPLGMIAMETIGKYGVSTLPHSVIIDKQGRVAAVLLGNVNNEKDIETIVNGLIK